MDLEPIDRFGRAHHGLVTFDAAARAGMTRDRWNAAAATMGELVHRDVVRLLGTARTPEQRIAAATLAAGAGAMASHRSASRLWGAERSDRDPVDVVLPSRTRRTRIQHVVVHRPRDLEQLRPQWRFGIPCTDPLRTLLDLGAVDSGAVEATLARFVILGYFSPAAVRAAVLRHGRPGRAGIGPLRRALDSWTLGEKPPDSELEIQMAAVRQRYRLPSMEFHAVVEGFEVDFLVIGTNVIIECDGWGSHVANRDQFEFDRARDAAHLAAGYVPMRVTWRQLTRSPRQFARRLDAVLVRWAPELAISNPESLGAIRSV